MPVTWGKTHESIYFLFFSLCSPDLSGNTSLGSKKSLSPLTDTDFPLNRSKRRFPRHDQDQNHGWEGENQRDPAKYQDFEPVLHEDKRQMIRVDFILTGAEYIIYLFHRKGHFSVLLLVLLLVVEVVGKLLGGPPGIGATFLERLVVLLFET